MMQARHAMWTGVGVGVGLMYVLDPQSGGRRLFRRGPVDDLTLTKRVRRQLGRVSSTPGALDVIVDDGCVTLRGAILRQEVARVIAAVQRVPGVTTVVDTLDVRLDAASAPDLQGTRSGGQRRDGRVRPTAGSASRGLAVAGSVTGLAIWWLASKLTGRRRESATPPGPSVSRSPEAAPE